MDPNACLARLLNAYKERDAVEVIEFTGIMLDWLLKGGFLPITTPKQRSDIQDAMNWATDWAGDLGENCEEEQDSCAI